MIQHVLLIEDNESLVELTSTILMRQGYEVQVARNGTVGYEAAAQGNFDVIITDLMLEGIPGLEIIRRLREEGSKARIIAISGRGEVFLEQAKMAGADAALDKPFKIADFVAAIEGKAT
jgi:two-component system alkaline phosphatase synthesis response regulator PhoP